MKTLSSPRSERGQSVLFVVIGVILILLIGGWFFFRKPAVAPTPSASTDTVSSASPSENTSTFSSVMDLLRTGKNLRCTIAKTTDRSSMNGTVYVSGEKFRGDFTTTTDSSGKPVEAHVLREGDMGYMWTSAQPKGMKMNFSQILAPSPAPSSGVQNAQPLAFDKDITYSCAPWLNVDNSLFVVPTTIEFMDLSAQMDAMKKMMPSGMPQVAKPGQVSCATCAGLPAGESKTQCLKAFGCAAQ